jgi:flagellar basal-body rod modification protein FlgD
MGSIASLISQVQAARHAQGAAHASASLPASGSVANPMAAATGTTSGASSGSSSADISSSDFLTLLVTEMQNQDPTADTDPNEYINQLVQVNSLEQLISINQNLTTALGTSPTTPGATAGTATGASQAVGAKASSPPGSIATATNSPPAAATTAGVSAAIGRFAHSVAAKPVAGNLSVPGADPAALNVAHALDGQSHANAARTGLPPGQ